MRKIQALQSTISVDQIEKIAEHSSAVVQQVRSSMLAPNVKKSPPTFSSVQLAELCGIEPARVLYLAKKGDLPAGTKDGTRREWSLVEARHWIRALKVENLRDPALAVACTISVCNFKGGVGKTTTAAVLAQGLSLRGHKVLVVDTDPQGSLTTLFGVLPDLDVEEEDTVLELFSGRQESILPLCQKTYWDGVDLVPSAPLLFNGEFILPSRQRTEKDFKFWKALDRGLDGARGEYDVIIIDTPPSLSYITINALVAADGIVMPLPPNALDFASSSQFWGLLSETLGGLYRHSGDDKKIAFVDVLLSRVDKGDVVSSAVREWIVKAYGAMVLPVEIPKTSVAATASAEFSVLYDIASNSQHSKTLKRAKDSYDQFVDTVELQIAGVWQANAEMLEPGFTGTSKT